MWMWNHFKNLLFEKPEHLSDQELLKEIGINPEDDVIEEKTTKDGTITQLFQDYGMIDDEFYFPKTMTPKICERALQIGDEIQFLCSRKNENQQWKVQEILMLYGRDHHWMEENNVQIDNPVHSRDVGKVTKVEQNIVFVEVQSENDFTEELEMNANLLDFQPMENDLLVLDVALRSTCLDDMKEAQILAASALRKQELVNVSVTSWWSNLKKGIIDGNIFFTDSSFSHVGYTPQLNDQVRIYAIECEPTQKTRNCNWRAISLVLNSHAGRESQSCLTIDRDLLRDKFGVHVEDTIDFGPIGANQHVTKSIPLQNLDKNGRNVTVIGLDFQVSNPPIFVPDKTFPIVLPARTSICINVNCHSTDFGATQILTLILLENDQGIRSKIGTIIKLDIRDALLDQMQGNMKPFVPRFQQYYQKQGKAEHVIKAPKKKTNLFVKKRLGYYPIPKNVEEAYYKDDNDLIDSFPVLGQALTMTNYKEKFAKLIYLEELENTEIMTQYSLCSVAFQRHGQYLSLEVPGLAEKRPSLALGDVAIIRQFNRKEAFEGTVFLATFFATQSNQNILRRIVI